jgi:hydroxyacylglutathione hydrolase
MPPPPLDFRLPRQPDPPDPSALPGPVLRPGNGLHYMATIEAIDLPEALRERLAVVRIESLPFAQNTYVMRRPPGVPAGGAVDGAAACLVVDPGFEPEAIVGWIDRERLEPAAILLTHGHSDHIAGNAALRRRWPGLPIMIGRHDAAKLGDAAANLSAPFGLPLVSPPADRLLTDGERLEVGGFVLDVREIPGHSSGHVVFVLAEASPPVVLGGDVLFREGVGRSDFPDGDAAALAAGIRRRLYTLPDETLVLPGHGDPTTIGHERRHNPFVRDASPRGASPHDASTAGED